jgi:hypothetical protein
MIKISKPKKQIMIVETLTDRVLSHCEEELRERIHHIKKTKGE